MGYTNKVISLDPEWGFEPTLQLLTKNIDYKATALPSELSSFNGDTKINIFLGKI